MNMSITQDNRVKRIKNICLYVVFYLFVFIMISNIYKGIKELLYCTLLCAFENGRKFQMFSEDHKD